MAPRSSWKGFLKLSLVSVPVRAFTAHETGEEVRLNQLHRNCHLRIRYKKVCPEHGEVANEDIVSGYKYAKDHYVVIDPDEIDRLRTESDKSVAIEGFVPADAIDPVYFAGRTYYLLPDGVAGQRPYALLARGMADAGVQAVAKVVIARREQLVAVRPTDGLLEMTALHFDKQVKAPVEFEGQLKPQDLGKEELQLAHTLIEASRLPALDLAAYPDAYGDQLTKLIRLKLEGEEVVQAPEREEPKILNLMEALKESVAQAQAGERKMAPSVKQTAARKRATKKKSG
jgi:DNA end-binding protein Ku